MKKSLNIAGKIWLSFSILLIGYCLSIVLGFRFGQQTEERLRNVSGSLFSAATQSQLALTAFDEQIKLYNNAVLLEDEKFLESAQKKAKELQHALQTIIALRGLDAQKSNAVQQTLTRLREFTTTAQIVYAAMGAISEYPENAEIPITEQASQLAQQTSELRETLTSFRQAFSDALKDELSSISEATRRQRYRGLISFLVVVFFALISTAIFIKHSISNPISQLADVASKIAVGDLSGRIELHSTDELGIVANAFREMMAYIQNVALVAQQVAVGEINVSVEPKSEHDVLNQAFTRTIQYIQDVANIAEKISHKDLQVMVTPKSERDVLNLSLQRMVKNLQEMIDQIQASVKTLRQQHWIRKGQTELNSYIHGQQDIPTLAQNTITYLARYLNAQIGRVYLMDDTAHLLRLAGSYAYMERNGQCNEIPVGKGLIGQSVLEKRFILFDDVPENYLSITSSLGETVPKYILIAPFLYEGLVKGVLELGAVHKFTELETEFLNQVIESIAIAFHSAQSRVKMQELLEKTQRQAEELLSQQKLLEKANTELKQTEEELRKTNQQLQEASQHKTDFLANMSHELRTPLNAIFGFTSMTIDAVRDTIPLEHLQNLIKAEQAVRILMQLISDILDFSKIEAGRMETHIEEFPLADLIEEVIITAEGLVVDKEIELNYETDPDLPDVESDYIKVKQILNNLVSNAVKFTDEGGVTIRANVLNPSESDGEVRVEVEDTGCGIPEDNLATIFESFKQVDGSIKKRFGGTGLGLAITKGLCDSLGIDIGVWSEEGKGTTFWLTIPVRPYLSVIHAEQAAKTRQVLSDFQEGPEENREEEFFPELSSPAVVVCLASQETCEMIEQSLRGFPLELQHVTTVDECIELAETQIVWTILVEPNGDRVEALAQLKNELSLAHIPIIFYSEEIKSTVHTVTRVGLQTILIIDDNQMNLDLMAGVFRVTGFTVYTANSGQAGIDTAKAVMPDVIVMDLAMPEMDGFEATQQIKQEPAMEQIPVIACTAFATKDFQKRSFQAGCEGYISKPLEPGRLVEQVTKQVLIAKIRRRLRKDGEDIGRR